MIVKIVRCILVPILALAAMVASGSFATAVDCGSARTCVWSDSNYGGAYGYFKANNSEWTWAMSDGQPAYDRVSSLRVGQFDGTGIVYCSVDLYDYSASHGYTGPFITFYDEGTVNKYSADAYLSNGGGHGQWSSENWNDRIGSNRYEGYYC